jgi:3-isopropylmalate/(R)-2-methylmalate dehydratase small subunit
MKSFTQHEGLVVPLLKANIDTDAIMPKQFLKSIKRTGYGDNVFDEWRYLDHGEPGLDCSKRPLNPDFPLNKTRYKGASILVTGPNFGCGSSREHAPWGLAEYGFRVIIAPSFADIFYNNCTKNGILPICLDQNQIDQLETKIEMTPGFKLTVDLSEQTIELNGMSISFDINSQIKNRLLEGLDDIAITLAQTDVIKEFEAQDSNKRPWLKGRIK